MDTLVDCGATLLPICNTSAATGVTQNVRDALLPRFMAVRACHLSMSERTDLNMTRRLRRLIRLSGLPLAGPAHQLRMDYVRATHALCILQRQCTFGRIVIAMRELLEGWDATEEEHSRLGGYQHRLLNAVDEQHSEIERWAWADLPAWP